MISYYILSFILGGLIGYSIFYFRYKHKDTVNELRSNLKDASRELNAMTNDLEEYKNQNTILKTKMSEFLDKNDDLSKVVGELSKYYYHIKKASLKTQELSKFLTEPDPEIEEKMKEFMLETDKYNQDDEKKYNNSFF